MGFWARIRDAWGRFWGSSKTVTTADHEFAEWLGISAPNEKLSEVTYFTCLKMMSETVGKLPLKFYQTTDKGKIRADPDDMTRLLTVRPNPVMTPTALFTACELNCQHYGNGYIWIQRQLERKRYGGEYKPVGLWVLPSKQVSVVVDNAGVFQDKGKLWYQYQDEYSGESYVFPQEDIIHVRTSYSFNGILGKPVRQILGDMIDGARESQRFMEKLCGGAENVQTCFSRSFCVSADVTAALDPLYAEVSEKQNAAKINYGVGFCKFTGSRGKSGASDASAELVGYLRRLCADAGVLWQMCELGKVDQGGGGTVAMFMAQRDIDTIDAGVPVLSMHAPYETTSKLDCYMTYKCVKAAYNG